MVKLILKILALIILVSGLVWLNFVDNQITIEFDQFLITTTILRFVIVCLVIIIPILLFTKAYGTLKSYFSNRAYSNSMMDNIDLINSQRDKDFLKHILAHSNQSSHLSYFKNLNQALLRKDYIKLQKLLHNKQKPKNLQHIIDFYQAMVDLAQSDQISAIEVCKKYINTSHKYNQYFAIELCEYALEGNNYPLCEYIISYYSNINFNKENKLKYYSLLQYKIAQQYISLNKNDLALEVINDVINKYPEFAPIYDLQFKLLIMQQDQKVINKLLENIWKKYPNYDNIILYTTYYQSLDQQDINPHIQKLKTSSKNDTMNLLLCANLCIKFNKLIQAHDFLNLVQNTYVDFIKIQLLSKEGNYQELLNLIKHKYLKSDSFWQNYI